MSSNRIILVNREVEETGEALFGYSGVHQVHKSPQVWRFRDDFWGLVCADAGDSGAKRLVMSLLT